MAKELKLLIEVRVDSKTNEVRYYVFRPSKQRYKGRQIINFYGNLHGVGVLTPEQFNRNLDTIMQ